MTFMASVITASTFDGIKEALSTFANDPKFVKEAYDYVVDLDLVDDYDEEKFPAYLKSLYSKAENILAKELKFQKGKLQIWRAITVKDPEQYLAGLKQGKYGYRSGGDYRGLGIFWSWRYSKSMPTPGSSGGEKLFLQALVSLDAIDLKGTAISILDQYFFREEKEIRLKEDASVELIDILDGKGKSLRLGSPIKLVAFHKNQGNQDDLS